MARLAGFVSQESIKGTLSTALTYAADLCYQLTVTREFDADAWTAAVAPFLTPFIGGTEAHSVAEGTRTRCVWDCTRLLPGCA